MLPMWRNFMASIRNTRIILTCINHAVLLGKNYVDSTFAVSTFMCFNYGSLVGSAWLQRIQILHHFNMSSMCIVSPRKPHISLADIFHIETARISFALEKHCICIDNIVGMKTNVSILAMIHLLIWAQTADERMHMRSILTK
jgi:hypothetical protein